MDFLREALRVLMDAIMDAEVSARIGVSTASAVPIGLLTATVTAPARGYQGRHDGASHTEAQGGELLPESS